MDDLILLCVDTKFMQKLPRKERRNDCGDESHMKVRVEDFRCQGFSQSLFLMQEDSVLITWPCLPVAVLQEPGSTPLAKGSLILFVDDFRQSFLGLFCLVVAFQSFVE